MARWALAGQGGGVDNGVFSSFPAAARFDSAVMARPGPLEVLRYNFLATFSGVASVGIGRNSSAEVKDVIMNFSSPGAGTRLSSRVIPQNPSKAASGNKNKNIQI
jgi:hypothetical protein